MKNYQTIFKYLILLVFLYLFVLILTPFFVSIVFAVFFAVVLHPLFLLFAVKFKINRSLAAILVEILTIVFILAPIVMLLGLITREAFAFIQDFDKNTALQFLDKYSGNQIFGYELNFDEIKVMLQNFIQTSATTIYQIAKEVGAAVANFTFLFFVFLFMFFYFLRDGRDLIMKIKRLLPFEKNQNQILLEQFKSIAQTVFVANLSMAVLSGIIAFVGFKIFGLPGALIWALIVAILSLIPSIGSFLVYIIAGGIVAYLVNWQMCLGLMIYFLIFELGMKENYLKPKLLDDKLPVHPILVFLALVGGVNIFGSMGIIYGPVIVVLFITIFEFVTSSKEQE